MGSSVALVRPAALLVWGWSLVMFSPAWLVDTVMSQTVGKGLFDHGEIFNEVEHSLWRR